MQSQNQFPNILLDLNSVSQLQIPIICTTPVFLNGLGIQTFQNFGVGSLTNASNNTERTEENFNNPNKIVTEKLIRRSTSEKKTNWTPEEDHILRCLVEEEKL